MDAWTALTERIDELVGIAGISSIIGWDEQTYMPPAAADTLATTSS